MERTYPPVVIIVLAWNQKKDTLECLNSLSHVTYRNFSTVLVDNGSGDETVAAVKSAFPSVHVLENGCNLGYSGGNNVGITYALKQGADYVFILNNDTTVDPNFLDPLVEYAETHPRAGMLCPKVYQYNEPRKIWFAGATFNRYGVLVHHGMGDLDEGQFNEIQECAYVPGCSLLVRKTVIAKVGMLEETFFCLFEEVDWCFKVQRAGYHNVLVPSSCIWHKESKSFGGTTTPTYLYYFTRNQLLMLRRNFKGFERYRLYFHSLRHAFRRQREFRRSGDFQGHVQARAIVMGILDFWRGSFGICRHDFRNLRERPTP